MRAYPLRSRALLEQRRIEAHRLNGGQILIGERYCGIGPKSVVQKPGVPCFTSDDSVRSVRRLPGRIRVELAWRRTGKGIGAAYLYLARARIFACWDADSDDVVSLNQPGRQIIDAARPGTRIGVHIDDLAVDE